MTWLQGMVKDINGNWAIRAVLVDAPDLITDILISSDTVSITAPIGTVVGNLSSVGGAAPYTYSDPGGHPYLEVQGSQIVTTGVPVLGATSITVTSIDANLISYSKPISITATAAPAFSNDYSMSFNGIDEYISTPVDLSGDTAATISGWFYRPSTGERLDIAQSNLANNARIKIVRNDNGSLYAVLGNAVMQHASDNFGAYEHIVLVYDGTVTNNDRVKMYVNGAYVTPISIPATWPTALPAIDRNLNIGFDDGSGRYTTGNIDEVSIWSSALTLAQVQEIYNSGNPDDLSTHSSNASLMHWYRLGDELVGTTMPDQAGTADGTLVNMDNTNRSGLVP